MLRVSETDGYFLCVLYDWRTEAVLGMSC